MLEGGCHCGAIRYIVSANFYDADYCHCNICRKISGAPVSAFIIVKRDAFAHTKGMPSKYASSAYAQRDFCGACGSALIFLSEYNEQHVEITIGSHGNPKIIEPSAHFWTSHRLPWFNTADELPRYAEHD